MPETPSGSPIYVTVSEALGFAKLALDDHLTIQDCNQAIEASADETFWRSPEEETARSQRAQPMRKHAQLSLSAYYMYSKLAAHLALSLPQKETLSAAGGSLVQGPDSPTPTEYMYGLKAMAQHYLDNFERIIKQIVSIGATVG